MPLPHPHKEPSAVVIGAGVSGLTSAHELARAGYRVEVVTREPSSLTTSAVAAAIWWPYDPEPVTLARNWATASLERFRTLAQEQPESGVRIRRGRHRRLVRSEAPWFSNLLHDRTDTDDTGVVTETMTAPLVDMPIYLDWLVQQCVALGVEFVTAALRSLYEVRGADVVVNCSGLGASTLVDDIHVRPLRGQLVITEGTGITEFVKDETLSGTSTYIYPRTKTVVLGGTTDASDDLAADGATTRSILERCAALDSRVERARVVEVKVGLRPIRHFIRLEAETAPVPIVHNYGHGRAGVSLSWGCAAEVTRLCNASVPVR